MGRQAVSLSLGAPDAVSFLEFIGRKLDHFIDDDHNQSDLFLRDDIQFGNSNEARFCPDLPSWTLDTQGLQNTVRFLVLGLFTRC